MAFLNRISVVLRQTVNKHMNMELSASNSSLYQAIRSMSSSKLFIGGLSYGTDEMSLREAFSQHGEVVEARIIMDRETGRSRGFGFVTYTSSDEASSAIQSLDGQELHGRQIRVNYATEKPRAGGFRGGFGNEGGFGYGGGGGNYGGSGGYGNNSYGGPGGYGNASNYGDAGGNFGGAEDGYGNSSYGGGPGYNTNNYNSSDVGNYAGGASSSDGVSGDGGSGASAAGGDIAW